MSSSRRFWIATLAGFAMPFLLPSATAFAQQTSDDEAEQVEEEVDALEKELEDQKDGEGDAEELMEATTMEEVAEEVEERQSADGQYEFKRSYGAGVELGFFFTPLDRWNTQLLEPNNQKTFDTGVAYHLDLAVEFSPIEGGRFAVFGGLQSPGTDDPSLNALYVGLEPAFAFRKNRWELAVGSGVALGRVNLDLESGASATTGLVLLRPFVEARTYAASFAAVYARFGFNYWHIYDEELNGLTPSNQRPTGGNDASNNLNEGGPYVAVGTRFGHYPEPIARVPDSDGDGLKDDIDDCPDEPEDFDQFQDSDGCPDLDNDKDGINDAQDQCPLEPEDKDGFQDEDGCPDPDNDKDGILDADDACPIEAGIPEEKGCPVRDTDNDGILNDVDKCPNDPEDKDGFQDEDGCPDPDNDQDGLLDGVDQCPLEAETYNGNKDEDGCPDGDQTVIITKTEIKITEQIFFDTGKATIKKVSFPLLDTVATVLKQNPQITSLRVEGHTDDVGKDEANLQLSKERAASVKQYLIDKGLEAGRLDSEGYGETVPLCGEMEELLKNKSKNKTAIDECRAANRRVQFKVVAIDGKPIDASTSVTIEDKQIVEEPIKKEEAPKTEAPANP